MGTSAPVTHQPRARLQHDTGIERSTAFLERSGQRVQTALEREARTAMGALLQLVGKSRGSSDRD